MQKTHEKAIRGISIAVMVLSIIGLAGSFLGLLGLLVGVNAFDSYNYHDLMGYSIPSVNDLVATHHGFDIDDYDNLYGFDDYDLIGMSVVGLILGSIAFIWAVITNVVTLIAGILGMRHYNNPEKLKMLFVWFVIGAIVSLLNAGIATMVLLIINAVFVHKDRTLLNSMWQNAPYSAPTQPYDNPYAYGTYNPVDPTSPEGYNTSVYGAPTPVYGQPQTPVNETPMYGTYPTTQPYTPTPEQTYQPVDPAQPVQSTYEQAFPYQQPHAEQPLESVPAYASTAQEAAMEPESQAHYFNAATSEPAPQAASFETPAVELTLDPEGVNSSIPAPESVVTPIELTVENTESAPTQEASTTNVSSKDSNSPTNFDDNVDSAHNDNPYHSSHI